MLGKVPDDGLVGFDRLVPFLELLRELTEQIVYPWSVLGIRIILSPVA